MIVDEAILQCMRVRPTIKIRKTHESFHRGKTYTLLPVKSFMTNKNKNKMVLMEVDHEHEEGRKSRKGKNGRIGKTKRR
jgi:hypothetical protein